MADCLLEVVGCATERKMEEFRIVKEKKRMEEFTLGVISSILISFKALFRVLPAPKILAHYYL